MLKISYGESNLRSLMEDGAFYQDRTHYIPVLEDWRPKFLVYLRPRRFGKSLFLSTLEYYYGLEHKDAFDKIFGSTFIGKNPTPKAHKYMVLKFDFSGINTDTEAQTFEGFLSNIQHGIGAFLAHYDMFFTKEQAKNILKQEQPNEMIKELFAVYANNKIENKIYVLIDEYDHFANELISFNYNHFNEIISGNAYVRKVYEVFKIATSQSVIGRIFITGVSPVTVDSMTSGFNISKNITLSLDFHQMVGFDEAEVKGILEKIDMPNEQIPDAVNDMRLWYNGYLFAQKATNRLYNPNMVLYFAQEYQATRDYPEEMLDANTATDYGKIRQLFKIQGKEEAYLPVLRELLEQGEVTASLTRQYSFSREFTKDDLVSLLFYMGFLTIKNEHLLRYKFTFPNYVIKKLYADYFFNSILERAKLPFDNGPVNDAIEHMAQTGDPKMFFEQVQLVIKYFSTRDSANFNENSLKAIIISLLHQQKFYYIHSEYETDWRYMDVYLEAMYGQKPNFEVTMELKFAQKKAKISQSALLKEAATQLQKYLETPKFSTKPNLKSFCVAVVGDKLTWKEL